MREFTKGQITWHDLNPDIDTDIEFLSKTLSLTTEAKKTILNPAHFQKIQKEDSYTIVILHYPLFDRTERRNYPIEIDFIITQNSIFTLHNKPIHFFDSLFADLDNNIIPNDLITSLDLYTLIISKILSACIRPLDHMASNIENIEEKIFVGNENDMIHEIAVVKRDILDFRKIIRLQKSTIENSFKILLATSSIQPEKQTTIDIIHTNIYIWQTLENLLETIEALEDLNQTIISHKLNTNIKTLTIFAAIMAPGTLLVGLFGMNAYMPYLDNLLAFPIIALAILTVSILLLIYFKYKEII